jgi:hypothetical protein
MATTSHLPPANLEWWQSSKLGTAPCQCEARAFDAIEEYELRAKCAAHQSMDCDRDLVDLRGGASEVPCRACSEFFATGQCPHCGTVLCDRCGPRMGAHRVSCEMIGARCMSCGEWLVRGSSYCGCEEGGGR